MAEFQGITLALSSIPLGELEKIAVRAEKLAQLTRIDDKKIIYSAVLITNTHHCKGKEKMEKPRDFFSNEVKYILAYRLEGDSEKSLRKKEYKQEEIDALPY